ncbi:MAG TPA: UDP-N-acetylmuramoyl-tripeptide--D-alanyl-D-alanine ligase, partial [Desulfurivibrionaceae bacterium]|nr:UDP-N-acetylmuramoyl-tripeptide--D-alanyl-D-alanine ligase [Desulfurivibrionaceae bacterium]
MNIDDNSGKGTSPGSLGYGLATVQDQPWILETVLAATGGRLLGSARQVVFRSVCTDTRVLEPGDLFVALAGENFDGESFAAAAVARGAAGLVLSRPPASAMPVPVVLVADTLRALGDLAGWRRSRMPDLRVLAITGSSGKTTVKEMTAAILARKLPILKTAGNFNNLVGLPLSLLPVDARHRVAVLEMGMNSPGEIARMTEIADPDLACINNIQAAHLQGLDDINGVARAKEELYAGLKPGATLVVNLDDPLVRKMAEHYPQARITFGCHRQALIRATHVRTGSARGVSFTLHLDGQRCRVRLRCVGRHNVLNALAAAALAHGVGIGIGDIQLGLE